MCAALPDAAVVRCLTEACAVFRRPRLGSPRYRRGHQRAVEGRGGAALLPWDHAIASRGRTKYPPNTILVFLFLVGLSHCFTVPYPCKHGQDSWHQREIKGWSSRSGGGVV